MRYEKSETYEMYGRKIHINELSLRPAALEDCDVTSCFELFRTPSYQVIESKAVTHGMANMKVQVSLVQIIPFHVISNKIVSIQNAAGM